MTGLRYVPSPRSGTQGLEDGAWPPSPKANASAKIAGFPGLGRLVVIREADYTKNARKSTPVAPRIRGKSLAYLWPFPRTTSCSHVSRRTAARSRGAYADRDSSLAGTSAFAACKSHRRVREHHYDRRRHGRHDSSRIRCQQLHPCAVRGTDRRLLWLADQLQRPGHVDDSIRFLWRRGGLQQ